MRKVELWVLSAKIRRKWKQVEDNRDAMRDLLDKHEAYTSERLVGLNLETTRLGYEARELERQYMEKIKEKSA